MDRNSGAEFARSCELFPAKRSDRPVWAGLQSLETASWTKRKDKSAECFMLGSPMADMTRQTIGAEWATYNLERTSAGVARYGSTTCTRGRNTRCRMARSYARYPSEFPLALRRENDDRSSQNKIVIRGVLPHHYSIGSP
jgi:hypothetical protein